MSKNKEEINEALKNDLIDAIKRLQSLSDKRRKALLEALADERTAPNQKQLREFFALVFTNGVVPRSDSKIFESLCNLYPSKQGSPKTFAKSEKETAAAAPKKTQPKKGKS